MTDEMNKMMENELENVAGGALGDRYYVVLPGDTLSAIAVKHRTTVEKLMSLNPRIKNANMIYAGETIRVW